jgi:adenosylmethionine-8-amino-7-oxononanoate aminotransferase
LQRRCVEEGIWVRPFRDIVYLTPSFTIAEADLAQLTATIIKVLGA